MRSKGIPGQGEPVASGDEYLSIAETAMRLKLSPHRLRNMMSARVFERGYHYFRRQGMSPRFKWSRVVEWLEEPPTPAEEAIPMARDRRFVGLDAKG